MKTCPAGLELLLSQLSSSGYVPVYPESQRAVTVLIEQQMPCHCCPARDRSSWKSWASGFCPCPVFVTAAPQVTRQCCPGPARVAGLPLSSTESGQLEQEKTRAVLQAVVCWVFCHCSYSPNFFPTFFCQSLCGVGGVWFSASAVLGFGAEQLC